MLGNRYGWCGVKVCIYCWRRWSSPGKIESQPYRITFRHQRIDSNRIRSYEIFAFQSAAFPYYPRKLSEQRLLMNRHCSWSLKRQYARRSTNCKVRWHPRGTFFLITDGLGNAACTWIEPIARWVWFSTDVTHASGLRHINIYIYNSACSCF